ncbi:unnamed protein product [Allacma fusca]|uniref:AAA+ ATPase domain-containing protein n=1 Tax=Allacma fusca TaxID=39272 RepID=A0A8J2KHU4_9HEXA|nr:unnamed protein product [Allacma fusca]
MRGCTGVLLFGAPGNGKSVFAEATAYELNVPFYNVQASELKSKWHGESEKLVHGLFEQLRKNKVSVLFLDEVDSVTSKRNQQDGMSTFKTQLLVEMSGINSRTHDGVILVLAATNLPMNIDPAFLSRFSYRLHIKPPNDEQRLQIIRRECSKHGIEIQTKWEYELMAITERFSGRDIAGVLESLNRVPLKILRAASHFKPIKQQTRTVSKFEISKPHEKGAFPSG